MKIGVLQLNPIVGDLEGNARKIVDAVREATLLGADFCVTSEMALTGYPPRDLLLYEGFVSKVQAVAQELARELSDAVPVLMGSVTENSEGHGKCLYNSALWCEQGIISQSFHKTLLPTDDVFDEARYFESASPQASNILIFREQKIGVTLCEDIWNDQDYWNRRSYGRDPLESLVAHGADLIVNLSASPFSLGKHVVREDMLAAVARKHATPIVYVNQCGGNDDLVFDGRSCVHSSDGVLLARAPGFEESLMIVAPDCCGDIADDDFSRAAETWRALVLGTHDYVEKSGFSKVIVGLSGGIDSAVTAVVAAHALGPQNVTCVLMPSPYSSQGSIDDSLELVANLGLHSVTLPIEPVMEQFSAVLAPVFEGYSVDTTEENIQSRIRGNLLMALSNKFGALLLTTGNKSELAVGYCTIYGDMSGGYAVISDVDKTGVFNVARWYNENIGPNIPEAIITKPPSAELRPDQKDADSLPPYEILDSILRLHIEQHQTERQIVATGHDPEVVAKILKLVRSAEFKRRQAAPGIKLTARAFGTGWRMPLACKRELR